MPAASQSDRGPRNNPHTPQAKDRVLRFLEKPKPEEIQTNNINAGVYILETPVLELMPPAVKYSIERSFFPALLERGDPTVKPIRAAAWHQR